MNDYFSKRGLNESWITSMENQDVLQTNFEKTAYESWEP
jgi:hypothetical protein